MRSDAWSDVPTVFLDSVGKPEDVLYFVQVSRCGSSLQVLIGVCADTVPILAATAADCISIGVTFEDTKCMSAASRACFNVVIVERGSPNSPISNDTSSLNIGNLSSSIPLSNPDLMINFSEIFCFFLNFL